MMLVSAGAAAIVYSVTKSLQYSTGSAIIALFTMAALMRYGVIRKEGFNVFTGPTDISKMLRNLKEGFKSKDEEEDFKDKEDEEGFKSKDEEEDFKDKEDEEGFKSKDEEEDFKNKDDDEEGFTNMREGFISQVFQNITRAGYNSPGFGMAGPLVEGFEDEKKAEKKGKPAPAMKKEEMAMPFKLGEIPSQVKNGPHIDAGSTLIKAIQGLNPDQINAMTKDTKQLIDTQKSLMGMLGTMKPMMNDGKELMETFQQMFGENAKVM
ncbi:MAG: hypothetical protein EBU66_13795 [Bacteroidetes bacterium]|nr:hypothetical protein [Bacteroidota bacterium]